MSDTSKNPPEFPSALDPIPEYLTHYFERSAGPFLNICDLDDEEVQKIRSMEPIQNLAGFHEIATSCG